MDREFGRTTVSAGTSGQTFSGAARSASELAHENAFLHSVIDNFPGGIMVYDQNLRLVLCNQRQKELLEYPPYLFEFGMPTLEQIFRFNATRGEYGPGDIEQHVKFRVERAAKHEPHVFQRMRPNGTAVEVRGLPLPGGGFVTTYLEIDPRLMASASPPVPQTSTQDALPEVSSPATSAREILDWEQFQEKADNILRARSGSQIVGFHYLDINGFMSVKKRLGETGARALANAFAQRINRSIRSTDILGHIGEDDFVVLQMGVNRPTDVIRMEHMLIDLSRQPFSLGTTTESGRISVGVALAPRDGSTAEALRAKAIESLARTRAE